MNNILLSIIMPTYNRASTIPFNISLIKEQVKRNANKVELIICNDASTDNTSIVITELLEKDSFFKFIDYKEHAEIGVNLARCIDEASGKYFVFLGDDDIPAPFMVDQLLELLDKYPDVECFHFNRLKGNDIDGIRMKDMTVFYNDYNDTIIIYNSSEEFIKKHFRGMCFLSVYMISVKAWEKGKAVYSKDHLGFEYLAPVLYGVSGKKCLYLNYPLCIQRCLKKPAYDRIWPAYLYLGIPRLLKCLEEHNVISSWEEVYKIYQTNAQFNSSIIGYINNMIYRASLDKNFYKKYINEINSYQTSTVKKGCTYLILLPTWLNKINRSIIKILMKIFQIG